VLIKDPLEWAEKNFGQCELDDPRRTRRLVLLTHALAIAVGESIHAACAGDKAGIEGSYRFLRNSAVDPEQVEEGPIDYAVGISRARPLVLAIQDSTTLQYTHSVADELGDVGGAAGTKARGIWAHTTLLVDAKTGEPLGLGDQARWVREDDRPSRDERKKRPYVEKESYKWEAATRRLHERCGDLNNIITVCDRESDVMEYLRYMDSNAHRYVVRASADRCLQNADVRLWDFVLSQPVAGCRAIRLEQRGPLRGHKPRPGRDGRLAWFEVRYAAVAVRHSRDTSRDRPLELFSVHLRETNVPEGQEPAEWMLLTSECVMTFEQAMRVVRHYEKRWLIEDYHKAWKSGCGVEKVRLRTLENIERAVVVLAHVAVRLLQLRCLANASPETPSEAFFSAEEVAVVALIRKRKHPAGRPAETGPLTVRSALETIAGLGGWSDSQRNGKIGWQTLWRGWDKLQTYITGWRLVQAAQEQRSDQ
jgi:hypothetical protein